MFWTFYDDFFSKKLLLCPISVLIDDVDCKCVVYVDLDCKKVIVDRISIWFDLTKGFYEVLFLGIKNVLTFKEFLSVCLVYKLVFF